MLEAVVVREWRAIKGRLEVGLGVRATQKVLARANFADGIHRLAVLTQIHAREQRVHHPRLVGVHDELLVAHGEAALEPSSRVQHEVHARKARRD